LLDVNPKQLWAVKLFPNAIKNATGVFSNSSSADADALAGTSNGFGLTPWTVPWVAFTCMNNGTRKYSYV
jgi:hypothetical protein